MKIGEVLEEANALILFHVMLNNDAMKACQMLGYQGFKRMHRNNVLEFTDLHMCMESHAIDRFRMALDDKSEGFKYSPANLKEHFIKWDGKLGVDLEAFGKLQNAYREITGVECKVLCKAMGLIQKNYEKTGRWIKRFNEGNWASHDVHSLDDNLHKKYKKDGR